MRRALGFAQNPRICIVLSLVRVIRWRAYGICVHFHLSGLPGLENWKSGTADITSLTSTPVRTVCSRSEGGGQ